MGNLYKIYRMRNDLELNLTKDTFHIVSHYLRKLSSLQKHREVYCGTEVLCSFPKSCSISSHQKMLEEFF